MGAPSRREQPHETVDQRLRRDRGVQRGEQDDHDRSQHARNTRTDRLERTEQTVGMLGIAINEVLYLLTDMAGRRSCQMSETMSERIDDRRQRRHELVDLAVEHRNDAGDHRGEDDHPEQEGENRSKRSGHATRRQRGGERRQRQSDHDDDQDGEQNAHELLDDQAGDDQPEREQHRPIDRARCQSRVTHSAWRLPDSASSHA